MESPFNLYIFNSALFPHASNQNPEVIAFLPINSFRAEGFCLCSMFWNKLTTAYECKTVQGQNKISEIYL